MESETKRKPVNAPKGWQLKHEYVDETGQVFSKGKFIGTREAKNQTTIPLKSKDDEVAEKLIMTLSPELIKQLEEKFSKANEERLDKAMKEWQASLAVKPTPALNADDLAEALVKAQQYNSKGQFYRNVKDIDPLDYDPAGCVFTSYGTGYVIVDDVRQGQPVKSPYGRMFVFKQSMGRVTKIGPHAETYSALCSFMTHSKKEIEWLKSHQKFGIEFFTDSKEALDSNAMAAKILVDVSMEIKKLEQGEILRRARAKGIELGGNLDGVITKLIRKIAGERLEAANQALRNKFGEAAKDNMFAGAPGVTF